MRARTKRLYAVLCAAVLLAAALVLATIALQRHASLFYTPEILSQKGFPEPGRQVRLGGYVEEGSLVFLANAEMSFDVIDGSSEEVKVFYTGIAPDLFEEGQGVVATGQFDHETGHFQAENLLAKHDEDYQPRELREVSPAPVS